MARKPGPLRLAAYKLLKKFPDAPSRTLARRLARENNCTIESCRSMLRKLTGQNGEYHRKSVSKEHRLFREPRTPGWKRTKCPASLAEPWVPFKLEGVKRLGVISDIHYPYHSEMAVCTAVERLRSDKIDCLLINGDFCDFYTLSRFQKNPAKRDFAMERMVYREALEWIRGEFPKQRIVFKKGNHEERYDHWLWDHAPEICDIEAIQMHEWLGFEELGIEMVEGQRPILAGKLPIFHGHELPKGMASPVNPARGAYMRTAHTVMIGHHHRTSGHAESDLWHDEVFCWSVGCLCDLTPEYARINKWNYGFAEVELDKSGGFDVTNFRISKKGEVRSS